MRTKRTIVLDDDPTGIQTVHGNLLLTRWDRRSLDNALNDGVPFFYILTNTRAMPPHEAASRIDSIVSAVLNANQNLNHDLTFVSRSDSTLRSHFPLEVDRIQHVLARNGLGRVDACFMIPAFFEGRRVTRDDTHYLKAGDTWMRTDETEFASDSVFGYPSSYLPAYIEHKSDGRIKKKDVGAVRLDMLREWERPRLSRWLNGLAASSWVLVNAETYDDMQRFCQLLYHQMAKGKRYLFQSAASFVKSFTRTSDKALLDGSIALKTDPGLVIVGSHVKKSSDQLACLLKEDDVAGIELDVVQVLEAGEHLLPRVSADIESAAKKGKTAVVFTSRREMPFAGPQERLTAGRRISQLLTCVVASLKRYPSFLVAKGGITAHDILVDGLGVASARVAGQIIPGVPVVRLPETHRWKQMPYVIFPGNVGAAQDLVGVVNRLRRHPVAGYPSTNGKDP